MKTRELIKKTVPEMSDKELARIGKGMLEADVKASKTTWHADDSLVKIFVYAPDYESGLFLINIHNDGFGDWQLDWID